MSPKTAVCSVLALLVIAPPATDLAGAMIWLALQPSYTTPPTIPLLLLSYFATLVIAMCVVGLIRRSSGHLMPTGRSWGLGISAFFAVNLSGQLTGVLILTLLGSPLIGNTLAGVAVVARLVFGVVGWIFVIKTIIDAAKGARRAGAEDRETELNVGLGN